MRFEILEFLPPYGPMPIAVTEDGSSYYSAGFPVRFFRTDGTDWVGNFAPGSTKYNEVLPLRDSAHILVIAGGICYVMHPDHTSPVESFGEYYVNAIPMEDGRIILQGNSHLSIIHPDGTHWNTGAISFWDFKELRVKGSIITGLAMTYTGYYEDVFVPFTYDIDTKTLTEKEYIWE